MNQTTHTPGPWIFTSPGLRYLSVHADSGNPHMTRGRICQVDDRADRSEYVANANLIAAAPDLLAALQSLSADLKAGATSDTLDLSRLCADLAAVCDAAIAKAQS